MWYPYFFASYFKHIFTPVMPMFRMVVRITLFTMPAMMTMAK